MEVEQYLRQLSECPNELLRVRHGIYTDFSVDLGRKPKLVREDFESAGFEYASSGNYNDGSEYHWFYTAPNLFPKFKHRIKIDEETRRKRYGRTLDFPSYKSAVWVNLCSLRNEADVSEFDLIDEESIRRENPHADFIESDFEAQTIAVRRGIINFIEYLCLNAKERGISFGIVNDAYDRKTLTDPVIFKPQRKRLFF